MKKFLLSIFVIVLLEQCNAQVPDTLFYFDEDTHKTVVAEMQNEIDSLKIMLDLWYQAEMANEATVIADTYNFEIVDDRIKVELNKAGHNIWLDVQDGDTKIKTHYLNYEAKVLITNNNDTISTYYLKP